MVLAGKQLYAGIIIDMFLNFVTMFVYVNIFVLFKQLKIEQITVISCSIRYKISSL